jgi:hypothetical protein
MKRDMDLCRTILVELEKREQPTGWIDLLIDDHPADEVSNHVRLLAEADLIEAQDLTTYGGSVWKPKRLTWAGHEFLHAAKNDGVWRKAVSLAMDRTGTLTLELLKVGLAEVTKGLLTGKITLP